LGSHGKAFRHRRRQVLALIHGLDQLGIAAGNAGLAGEVQRDVGHRAPAAEGQRQLGGEGDGFGARQNLRRAAHETGLVVAAASDRLAQFDRVLGLEM
jgi:hypothetical protein